MALGRARGIGMAITRWIVAFAVTLAQQRRELIREAAERVDMHLTVPAAALSVAKALGVLPPRVFMVGCEPEHVDDMVMGLTTPVQTGVDSAILRIRELLNGGSTQ